jgi:hypothetical protein
MKRGVWGSCSGVLQRSGQNHSVASGCVQMAACDHAWRGWYESSSVRHHVLVGCAVAVWVVWVGESVGMQRAGLRLLMPWLPYMGMHVMA